MTDTRAPMILYHGWRSSASRRVRLVLAEKGLAYESRLIDMLQGEQHQPEYLAMNPNGMVPTLRHGERVLYESAVIAEYLDELFPSPPLLPADPWLRAQLRNFMRWIDEHCLPKLIVFNWSQSMQPAATQWSAEQLAERLARVPSAARREAWTRVARRPYTDDEKAEALRGLLELPARMQALLAGAGSAWLFGPAYSLGDIAAVPFIMRIGEIAPGALDRTPGVADWWARAQARPAFAEARIEPYEAPAPAAPAGP